MIIKIDTDVSDYRGILVIENDEAIGFINYTPDAVKKVLQAMLEDMNDWRKEAIGKDEWIQQVLEDEQQRNELLKDGEGDEGDEDWWRNDE